MSKVLMVLLNEFVNDSRVLRECRTLTNMGYEVNVFALHGGTLPEEEKSDSYRLRRISLHTRKWSNNPVVQVLKYLECLIKMVSRGRKLRPEVVHCHDIGALPIGFIMARLTLAKLIYDSHELWSENSVGQSRFKQRLFGVLAKVEAVLMRRTDRVITVSDGIADELKKRSKIERPLVIRNVPFVIESKADWKDAALLRHKFGLPEHLKILLYQGGMGPNQGLEDLVMAQEMVDLQACLVLIGEGPIKSKLQTMVARRSLGNRVFFHDTVSYSELLKYTSQASIGLSLSSSVTLNYSLCLPNKLFEYLQAGLPVIATDLPEMTRVIKEYDVGETYREGDPRHLANVINGLVGDPSRMDIYRQNAVRASRMLNWSVEQKRLQVLYGDLIPTHKNQ